MAESRGHEADLRPSQAAFALMSVASKEKKWKKMVAPVQFGLVQPDLRTPPPPPARGQLRILGKMTAPSWRFISGAKPSTFQTKVCTKCTWLWAAA